MDAAIPAQKPDSVVLWESQPGPQSALLACPCFEIFYGGARGGGKTDGCLGEWLAHADEYAAAAIGLWIRRTLTELTETIERSKQLFPKVGARWHESEKMWRFPNGARLRFAYLDNDSDADNYQGHSYTRVYVEEAGNFPSPAPIFKLIATLRSSKKVPTKIILTGNPGGPGQTWIKERYIDPAPLGWKIIPTVFIDPDTGNQIIRDRVFIPSRVRDNKYLGTDYVAGLHMVGSPQLVRAWLDGDFSAIVGAFFQDFSGCIIEPFDIPEHWTRLRSFDWGSARPFSVGWWAVADGAAGPCRAGELVRYREWYGAASANVGLELTDPEIATGIIHRSGSEKYAYSVADPSCWAKQTSKTGQIGKSTAEIFAEHGIAMRPANNDRISGWRQMRSRLRGLDGRPMVRCFSTCLDSIRTIPLLQHDEIKPEDVDTEGEDHAADEWRYAMMTRPWVAPAPTKTIIKDIHNATFKDLLDAHIRQKRAERSR